MVRLAGLAVIWLLHLSCTNGSTEITPGACYNIVVAPWPETADYGLDSIEVAPPPRVRLDTMTMQSRDGVSGVIAELPGVLPSVHSYGVWRYRRPDSLVMTWSTGYGGVVLRLRGSASLLTGSAESFFDYRDGNRTDAKAERVECSASVPVDHRAMPTFYIEMPSGDSLKIGSPIPADVRVDSIAARRFKARDLPARAFRGADSLLIDLSPDGRVTTILLHYPDTISAGELAARVEAFLGPVTEINNGESRNGEPHVAYLWVNRYYTASVSGSPNPHISVGAIRTPR